MSILAGCPSWLVQHQPAPIPHGEGFVPGCGDVLEGMGDTRRTDEGGRTFDEVYQLAADMGGMGFISFAECEIIRNNALINIHMTHNA